MGDPTTGRPYAADGRIIRWRASPDAPTHEMSSLVAGTKRRGASMDLGQMLAQTAASNPDKTAVIFKDQRTSFAELDGRANQVANALIGLGVEPGDRVALLMHNLPLFMEAYYGILKAGGSVVPMNPLYKAGEIGDILNGSGAKAP